VGTSRATEVTEADIERVAASHQPIWPRLGIAGPRNGDPHRAHQRSVDDGACIERCAQRGCVIRFIRVEFHPSASKHGIDDDDVLHAVAHALVVADMGDDESPLRTLVLGPGHAGNMIEVIVLHFDDGRELAIHAMPMRSHYRGLLPRRPETEP
jgi:hypothetical protein